MAAPFGFSVGDFVAGLKLLSDVIGALRDTTHATSEYQTTIVDLQAICIILGKVQARYSSKSGEASSDPQLALCVDLYAQHIAKFLAKLAKYETAFALPATVVLNLGVVGGSSRRKQFNTAVKHNMKRITWALKVKTDVEKLMIAVGPRLTMIGLYLRVEESEALAKRRDSENEFRIRVVALEEEFRELATCIKSSALAQAGIAPTGRDWRPMALTAIAETMEEEQAVAGAENEDIAVLSAAKFGNSEAPSTIPAHTIVPILGESSSCPSRLVRLRKALEHFMLMMLFFSHSIQPMFLALASTPRTMSLLHDDNINITDALGRIISRPYTDFRYFEIVKAHLGVAFRKCDGSLKVQRRNFGLFRQVGGREQILHEGNWEQSITPGSKIFMSMFVEGAGYGINSCPRCGTEAGGLDRYGWTTCSDCGLWHLLRRTELQGSAALTSGMFKYHGRDKSTQSILELARYQDELKDLDTDDVNDRIRQEDLEIFSFKRVHWSTYPCQGTGCNAVFMLNQDRTDHLYQEHQDEFDFSDWD